VFENSVESLALDAFIFERVAPIPQRPMRGKSYRVELAEHSLGYLNLKLRNVPT